MDTRLLPGAGNSGCGSTDEMGMDRAGELWVTLSLLKSCFSISQHHELYAWKHLMSSGCIQHFSIPALAAVPGAFPTFQQEFGGQGMPTLSFLSCSRQEQGSGIGIFSRFAAGF